MPIDAPIHTNESNLPRVLNAGLPVLLVFWRRDCAPCDALAPALDRLAKQFAGKALLVKVNVADEPALAQRYTATQLPQLVFVKNGQEVGRGQGAAPEADLAEWLSYVTAGGARPVPLTGPSVPAQGVRATASGPASPGAGAASASSGAPKAGGGAPVPLTDANFDQAVRSSQVPVLVDFWAEWCGPCKMVAPHVAALAQEFSGRALVAKMNVDENPQTAGKFGIMSIPTLLIFKGGRVVEQIVGAQPAQVMRQKLARHVG